MLPQDLTQQAGNQLGGFRVVYAENLQHRSVGKEGSSPAPIGGPELMQVLEDRPKLHPMARHKAHGPFDGRHVAQGRELIQEI